MDYSEVQFGVGRSDDMTDLPAVQYLTYNFIFILQFLSWLAELMYFAALPPGANGSSVQGLEKHPHQVQQQAMYLPAPFPGNAAPPAGYATAAAAAHPAAQQVLPSGLRYTPQPAYAVVSQAGYHAISPAAYHSVPGYSGMQALPATSTAYITAAQYPGLGYPPALASRSGSSPFQAGAPLIATGYAPHIPTGTMPGQAQVAPPAPRHYQIATYPPGYPIPAGSTVPMPYGAAAFGPPF
ncbi:hypothetical protein PoB_005182700 [Plakobranchus ocellatus]|uniref:Uncharacterized protein n=1 Tax=Plakobranchus ocellatus TaxID=259542 RepID=A0AAV4C224_9GAST|nr:hypothetical protein PoB_005182700 [Plakobranchus ocellatus]